MENKQKNKSINSVIYLLLAAMLIGVTFISVFTVASRRGDKQKELTSDKTEETLPETAQSGLFGNSGTGETSDTEKNEESAPESTVESKTPETSAKTAESAASKTVQEVPAAAELRYFVIPAAGTVSKAFDIDVPVYSMTMNDYRAHTGVDISAPLGSEVISASSGTVCKVWNDPLMGSCVTVDHGDDIYTTYMNLSEELAPGIAVGKKVAMGQSLGAIGETAIVEISEEPHVHLEMKVDGVYVDPLEYMGVASAQEIVYED